MLKSVTKIKLRKGDLVVVTRGRLKGQTGRVLQTHPRQNAVSVDNLNLVKKHQKGTPSNPSGGIIDQLQPINVSKVALVDTKTQRPTKISVQLKDGVKVRVAKRSQTVITSTAEKS